MRRQFTRRTISVVLVAFVTISIFSPFIKNVGALLEEPPTSTVKLNPSIMSLRAYSFLGEETTSDGAFRGGKVYVDIGTAYIDEQNVINFGQIELGTNNETGKTQVGFWKRYPIVFTINIYTNLDKNDVSSNRNPRNVPVTIPYGTIKTVSDWRAWTWWGTPRSFEDVTATNTYSPKLTLPAWELTTSTYGVQPGKAQSQVGALKTWFTNTFGYSGDLRIRCDLNPSIGAATQFDYNDMTFKSNNTYVRLSSAFTTNLKSNPNDPRGVGSYVFQETNYGLVSEGQNVIFGTNVPTDSTSTDIAVNNVVEEDFDFGRDEGGNQIAANDPIWTTRGLAETRDNPLTITNDQKASVTPKAAGSSLTLWSNELDQPYDASSKGYASASLSSFDILYPVPMLRPRLRLTTTKYTIRHVNMVVDIHDEWLFLGTAGIRMQTDWETTYEAITSFGVDNVYIQTQIGTYIDLCSTFNVEVHQGTYDEQALDVPTSLVDKEYWNAGATGDEGFVGERQTTVDDWTDFWVGVWNWLSGGWYWIVIVAVGVLVLFLIIRSRGGGGGKLRTKIEFKGPAQAPSPYTPQSAMASASMQQAIRAKEEEIASLRRRLQMQEETKMRGIGLQQPQQLVPQQQAPPPAPTRPTYKIGTKYRFSDGSEKMFMGYDQLGNEQWS